MDDGPKDLDLTCSFKGCVRHGHDSYRIYLTCSNCDWEGWAKLSRGHLFSSSARCPECDNSYRLMHIKPREGVS